MRNIKILIIFLIAISIGSAAYAAQTVNDRIEIDNDDIAAAVDFNNLFGYQIEAIGDLDGNGVVDLASIKFGFDGVAGDDGDTSNDFGSILILFMNADGSVASTAEITMTDTAGTGLRGVTQGAGECIAGDGTNRDFGSIEQLAFVGDLDGDGEPTIALGANSNDHDVDGAGGGGVIVDAGAVYMLELNADGTVDNCIPIVTENGNGFNPADGVYQENAAAAFGWPVIATDLNGDGRNELIVGATSEDDNYTDLWPLFLNADGTVASHPAVPVSGLTIGIDTGEYIDDGASVSGTKIVVSNQADGDGGGSIFIVNLSAAGAFVSTTQIAGSTIGGIPAGASFGSGVAPLGDMDNDGINDILVGNESGDDTNANSGEVYIFYLNSDDTLKESQKISNESENTRTATTPFAVQDLLGHGMALWRDTGGSAVIAIGAHQDDTGETNSGAIHLFYVTRAASVTATTGGDSDGAHKSKPTFGIDHKTNVQRVDDGLIINGEAFTVDDNFWTEIPMQYMNVGETQNFTATVFAPHQLHAMEFLFGIPEVGDWGEAEASVTITFDYAGNFEKIIWNNDFELINEKLFSFSTSKVLCTSEDTVEQCRQVSIELEFKEAPIGEVLALQAIDHKRRSNILYFNDGITILGESLNPPTIQQIMSEIKYKGLQTVQRIDKEHDIWMSMDKSEPVLLYRQNDFGTFIPIEYRTFEVTPDTITTYMDRDNSEFSRLLEYEINRALEHFGYLTSYKQIQGDDLTNYVAAVTQYTHTSRANDVILQQTIKDEELRAQALLVELLSKTHYASIIFNNSHVGIIDEFVPDDRPIREILAEERIMKKILEEQRSSLKQVSSIQNFSD